MNDKYLFAESNSRIVEHGGISLECSRTTNHVSESEALLRLMMDTIAQGTWTNTPDGKVTFYNEHFYKYTGFDKNEPKENAWKTFIHIADICSTEEQYKQILNGDEGGEFENRVRRKDGVYRWHLSRIRPIKNKDGRTFLWIGSSTDIHDMKLLQEYKDDFINIASHELKTPITSLKISLELLTILKGDSEGSMFNEMLDIANRNILRVNNLINNLLNAGKLNKGQLDIKKADFNLGDMLSDIVKQSKYFGETVVIVKGNTNRIIYGDETRLSQVLTNLVTNAFKYAPESKTITISVEELSKFIKISVLDEGKGIDKKSMPVIFNRYQRGTINDGTECDGLGLGLYISNEIILQHGGEMGIKSAQTKGTNVWFTVPF